MELEFNMLVECREFHQGVKRNFIRMEHSICNFFMNKLWMILT